MAEQTIGIIMNGVTGRMGTNQHLIRSILAIREQGGITLANQDRLIPDPILVGRNEKKLEALATKYGLTRWSTDLDACLANPDDSIYFDAQTTNLRADSIKKAIKAGKHIYCEKPTAENLEEALELARLARAAGVKKWSRSRQAVPPWLNQIEAGDRLRLFWENIVGSNGVRLLGF